MNTKDYQMELIDFQTNAVGFVNKLIYDAFRQNLWILTILLIMSYPMVVRIVRDAMVKPTDKRENSPFVYLMR